MTDMAVQIKDLTYYYPDSAAPCLSGISLNIPRNRFIVIMGVNGAGKTSLALCLNGIIPQLLEGRLLGEVRVGGKDARKTRTQSLAGTVGLVLQDPESQIIGLTVAEDTAFGPRNLGLSPGEIEERVQTELAKTGLSGYESRPTDELSGGEKQRLVLAGVLAMRQDVLVLDEPASELDPEGRARLYAVLDQLRREGSRTIIVIEHAIEDVWHRADEVIVLKEGKVAWQGEPRLLFQNLPLLYLLGIKPLTVSRYFWPFVEKGWLTAGEIPLSIEEAAGLLPKLPVREFSATAGEFSAAENRQSSEEGKDRQAAGQEGENNPAGTVVIRGLTHRYTSSVLSLDNIHLEIGKGEFAALIGPNGAGKTTLTKHLNGLLKPVRGDVWVSGKNTREFGTAQLAATVGYVFQNPDHQLFETTVEKELAFGLKKAGMSPEAVNKRVEEVLHDFDLTEYRGVHPLTLGKSVRQLLTVAAALVLKPDILVVDEPTKGLDWPGAQRMMGIMKKLHREGTTVIVITHDMELAAQAGRVIVLKDGRILRSGSPWEIFTDEACMSSAGIIPPQIVRLRQLQQSLSSLS
ncbi:MAG: ABC transporter ATP-binding protein [Peptococcaceae bacterium]|nr:ABC transporter ATP-binding protein [Peptococcaceae bacterium]